MMSYFHISCFCSFVSFFSVFLCTITVGLITSTDCQQCGGKAGRGGVRWGGGVVVSIVLVVVHCI